jgi:hypothetical protein
VIGQVLQMLEQGQTPPGIREIDDKPPNPNQEFPNAKMKPRPKVPSLHNNPGFTSHIHPKIN